MRCRIERYREYTVFSWAVLTDYHFLPGSCTRWINATPRQSTYKLLTGMIQHIFVLNLPKSPSKFWNEVIESNCSSSSSSRDASSKIQLRYRFFSNSSSNLVDLTNYTVWRLASEDSLSKLYWQPLRLIYSSDWRKMFLINSLKGQLTFRLVCYRIWLELLSLFVLVKCTI